MAEVVGVVASIVAVVELAKGVTTASHKYAKAYRNSKEDMEALRNELSSLINILERLKDDENSRNETLATPGGPLPLCQDILRKILARMPTEDALKGIKRILWPFKDGEIKEHLEKLERAKTILELSLIMDHSAISKEIAEICQKLQVDTAAMLTAIETAREEARAMQEAAKTRKLDEEQQKAVKWLHNDVDYESNHREARKSHQEGTGSWFLDRESFVKWLEGTERFIWLHGIPGAGKTVLLSSIIDATRENLAGTYFGECPIAYYYFSFRQSAKQNTVNMLSSVLAQLCIQIKSPHLLDKVLALYRKYKSQPGRPDCNELITVMESLSSANTRGIYVLLDALDECEQTEIDDVLFPFIGRLTQLDCLNIICTSRKETVIEDYMAELPFQAISIQSGEVDRDIELFVEKMLENDIRLRKLKADVKSNISQKLVSGAKGMFRWVECQIDSLRRCKTVAQITSTLESLPRTLHETYERILQQTPEENKAFLCRALAWIMYSKSHISARQLAEAMIVEPGSTVLNEDDRLGSPADPESVFVSQIISICGSLVRAEPSTNKIKKRWRSRTSWETHTVIVLAHYSVQEYLTSDEILTGPSRQFSLKKDDGHSILVEACITYLQWHNFHTREKHSRVLEDIDEKFPLYAHCARWDRYCATPEREKILISRGQTFFEAKEPSAQFILWYVYKFGGPRVPRRRPLHFAAEYRLPLVVEYLIRNGAQVDDPGHYTPLHYAAEYNSVEAIGLLIDIGGANILSRDSNDKTPIEIAIESRSLESFPVLLERMRSADLLQAGRAGSSLVHSACKAWNETAVIPLLDKIGNEYVDLEDSEGKTTLEWAIELGDDSYSSRKLLPRLLLERGANPNHVGESGESLLFIAVRKSRDIPILEALIDYGASIDWLDDKGYPAICNVLPTRPTVPKKGDLYQDFYAATAIFQYLESRGAKLPLFIDPPLSQLEYHLIHISKLTPNGLERPTEARCENDGVSHSSQAIKLLDSDFHPPFCLDFHQPFSDSPTSHSPFSYALLWEYWDLLEKMIQLGYDLEKPCMRPEYDSKIEYPNNDHDKPRLLTPFQWAVARTHCSESKQFKYVEYDLHRFLLKHHTSIPYESVASELLYVFLGTGELDLFELTACEILRSNIPLEDNPFASDYYWDMPWQIWGEDEWEPKSPFTDCLAVFHRLEAKGLPFPDKYTLHVCADCYIYPCAEIDKVNALLQPAGYRVERHDDLYDLYDDSESDYEYPYKRCTVVKLRGD